MSRKSLRTVDVARRTGVSVNTIRLYERLGYLPAVPRAENGYRRFDERHIRHVELVRLGMRCTWIGGDIRETTLDVLHIAARGDYQAALAQANALCELLHTEQTHAEEAIQVLEAWVMQRDGQPTGRRYRIGEVARRLHVSMDELRSWERNGLIAVPRAENGYRAYGEAEIRRLLVIRALRRARYSTMSILNLLQYLDSGHTEQLRLVLDAPPPDASIEQYPTDTWLSTLQTMCAAAEGMCAILMALANPP